MATYRLKDLARLNIEALAEDTPADRAFRYVDISGVDGLGQIVGWDDTDFGKAPSRARRLASPRDILVSTVRTYLRAIAMVPEEAAGLVFSTGFAVLHPKPDLVHPEFLWRALQTEASVQWIVAHSEGIGYPSISPAELGQLGISVPPLEEQRAIAVFLDRETSKIDALIASNERILALLHEKRVGLITRAVTKGLEHNVPMKDSGVAWLGEIPAHWEVKRIRHLGEAIIGLTYEPSDVLSAADKGVLVLRASNVSDGRVVLQDNVYVGCAIPDRLRTKRGDILICSRSGSRALIGKSVMIDQTAVGLTFGTFMTVLRTGCNDYLYYVLNSTVFDHQAGAFLTSTINQLTLGTLKDLTVPFPPPGERSAIVAFLRGETARCDALVAKAHHAIALLREYRTALISAAVTGQIDVSGGVGGGRGVGYEGLKSPLGRGAS